MIQAIKPSKNLQPYIKKYFIVDEWFIHQIPQKVLPNGTTILVFHYKQPSLFGKKMANIQQESYISLCGQQSSHYYLTLSKNTGMIFVIFKAFASGLFFPLPMKEVHNLNIDYFEIDKESVKTEETLLRAKSTQERIQIIENYLEEQLIKNYRNHEAILMATKLIQRNQFTKISDLSTYINLSQRQLERLFASFVGLSPKKYMQIMRFNKSLQLAAQLDSNSYDLTCLALDSGYYDQSHFIHDYQKITGENPSVLYKKTN